jgi:hypothetical protein
MICIPKYKLSIFFGEIFLKTNPKRPAFSTTLRFCSALPIHEQKKSTEPIDPPADQGEQNDELGLVA